MSTKVSTDLELKPLDSGARTLEDWLTTFHLVVVVLDPYTYESAWLLDTASRVMEHFREADCRIAWLVTGTEDEARRFLGPKASEFLTLVDPGRAFVKAAGIERLPALVHIGQDSTVISTAEGWDVEAWRATVAELAERMSWSRPPIPAPGDPSPYPGSPAIPAEPGAA